MTTRTAFLSSLLVVQLIASQSALAAAVSMDLSSVNHTIASPGSAVIREGGVRKDISVNQLITPAEQMALMQVLSTGHQSLILGALGNATGGLVSLNSTTANSVSNMVLPKGVTAVDSLAQMALSGNLTNFGKLYAVSPNGLAGTAAINANYIYNMQGGLISTILPKAGVGGYSGGPAMNLSLSALSDIINAGTISSAGTLALSAGGSIVNALPSGATGTAPAIQATNGLSLYTGAGSITNSGTIATTYGDMNIAAATATNLLINNAGGTLSAAAGQINVRDASFTGNYNTAIDGGDILANTLNVFSGQGNISVSVNSLQGVVNLTGCAGDVMANSGKLSIGTMNLTGDPTFYNTGGDVILTSDLSFPGQDLAIVASGNVIAQGGQIINTSSANNGGNITIIAGAHVTVSNGPANDTNNTAALLTIDTGMSTGGKIDLSTISALNSVGGFNAGGNITLVAYGGSNTGAGTVSLPTTNGFTVNTGSLGTDVNGNFTVFAGATSGNAITVGNINTAGANNGTGNIYMLNNNPSLSGCGTCTGTMTIVNGTITSGAFNTGTSQFYAPGQAGNIATGNLSSSGGSIQLLAGGQITTGTVNSTGANNTGRNGGIAMVAGAATGTAIAALDIITSGARSSANNILLMTTAPAILCSNCSYRNLQANTLGSISFNNLTSTTSVDLRAGGDLTALSITANGAGSSNGGQVGIIVDNKLGGSSSTFQVGGSGTDSVGTITVQPGSGGEGGIGISSNSTGGINVANQAALNIVPITSGGGGQIGLNAAQGTLTTPGTWNLSGVVNGGGGFLNLAGQSITFTNNLNVNVNGVGTGFGDNGGRVSISGANITLPSAAATISANGGGSSGQGGSVTISSTTNTILSADLTISGTGSGSGQGGFTQLSSNGTLNLGSGNISIDDSTSGGFGGLVRIVGGTTNQGAANITANVSSGTFGGGRIDFDPGVYTATTGSVSLTANSTNSDAGRINIQAGDMTFGSGTFTANANAGDPGYGGVISILGAHLTSGSGAITINANGGQGGGVINATIDSYTGGSNLALNANGTGTQAGAGGSIVVKTAANIDSLTVGSGAGQISATALGYGANGTNGDGGDVEFTAGANLTVDGSGINVSTSAANGNGGFIGLTAGSGGQGILQMTGNISANAAGNGNGGTIALAYADANPANSTSTAGTPVTNVANLSATAPGSGSGGVITIVNALSTAPAGLANNGTITVASASGTPGSITITAAGTTSAPTQDILVTGSGSFVGPVSAVGRNTTFNLTGTANLQAQDIEAVGGNLSLTVPNLVLQNSTAVVSSTGTATITSTTVTNNSAITAGGVLTVTNSGALSVSGTGSLQGSSITMSSTNGTVTSDQAGYTGTVSGSSAGAYSLTSETSSLTVGSISNTSGNLSVIANSGNLTVATGSTLSAGNGNLLIQNNAGNGTITLQANVTASANSTSGVNGQGGEVFIVLGPVPTSPVAGAAPSGVTVNSTNGGVVYFGANSIAASGTNTVNADNSTVIFNTGTAQASAITLSGGDIINATNPPPPPPPPPPTTGVPPGHGGLPPGQGGSPPGLNGGTPPGQGGTPPGQGGTPPGQTGTPPGQGGTPPGQGGTPPGQGGSNGVGNGGTPPGHKTAWAGDDSSDNNAQDAGTPSYQKRKRMEIADASDAANIKPVAFASRIFWIDQATSDTKSGVTEVVVDTEIDANN